MDDLDRCNRCACLRCECDGPFGYEDTDSICPTCKGRGTINPLTAPKGFFCVSTTECPNL
jgi:DnaJ-class molecular chaperone